MPLQTSWTNRARPACLPKHPSPQCAGTSGHAADRATSCPQRLSHEKPGPAGLPHQKPSDADLEDADVTGAILHGADLICAVWPAGAEVPEGWQRGPAMGILTRPSIS